MRYQKVVWRKFTCEIEIGDRVPMRRASSLVMAKWPFEIGRVVDVHMERSFFSGRTMDMSITYMVAVETRRSGVITFHQVERFGVWEILG